MKFKFQKDFFLAPVPEEVSCQEWPQSFSATTGGAIKNTPVVVKNLKNSARKIYKFINHERQQHQQQEQHQQLAPRPRPLQRSKVLERLARLHAQHLADKQTVHHSVSDISHLQSLLRHPKVGENVQRGVSVEQMHSAVMMLDQPSASATASAGPGGDVNRENVLDAEFAEIGVAVVLGKDGLLYMCQYFKGP